MRTPSATSLTLPSLGMGCAALGGLYSDVPEDQARATIVRALETGVNFFDTAPLYGHGKSEWRLGEVLAGRPKDSYTLATKVGRLLIPHANPESIWFVNLPQFAPVFDFSYDGVMRSFEQSLARLRCERVDILYVHDPEQAGDFERVMAGAYPALRRLREDGRIKVIGVGVGDASLLARFAREADFDCFLLAGRYTLLDQTALPELLPLCERKNVRVILGGPFNSGILASGSQVPGRYDYAAPGSEILEKVRALETVCRLYNVPLRAAALQFPLGHPAVVSVIPGARSPLEIEDNLAMMQVAIPRAFWEELRSDGLIPPDAPLPS